MLNDCVSCKQGLLMLICRPPLRTKWDNTSKRRCHICINSWSLNNMGFNHVGPLICRYFSIANTTVLQGWRWLNTLTHNHGYWERIPRADYKIEDSPLNRWLAPLNPRHCSRLKYFFFFLILWAGKPGLTSFWCSDYWPFLQHWVQGLCKRLSRYRTKFLIWIIYRQ